MGLFFLGGGSAGGVEYNYLHLVYAKRLWYRESGGNERNDNLLFSFKSCPTFFNKKMLLDDLRTKTGF